MTNNSDHDLDLPRALREALEEADDTGAGRGSEPGATERELLAELSSLLETKASSTRGASRLLTATEQAPLRYAPFFARLSALFDLDEDAVERTLSPLSQENNWKRTGLSGVRRITISGGPRLAGASASFVQFRPGTHFPRHHHLGFEQIFVLEGSYTDDAGVVHGPGNLHEMDENTRHEFWVAENEPCIAASVLHGGLRFTEWPLKFFNFLIKR